MSIPASQTIELQEIIEAVDSAAVAIRPEKLHAITADQFKAPEIERARAILNYWADHTTHRIGFTLASRARTSPPEHS